jgi:CrcB protein
MPVPIKNVLAVALGGGIGSAARYALSGAVARLSGSSFPYGTLCVNLLGCFAIGFLWECLDRGAAPPVWRVFLMIGCLGGFTTFSTFGIETFHLLRGAEWRHAALNLAISNAAGIALVFLGAAAFRLMPALMK